MRWIAALARIPPQHRRPLALIGVMFVMILLLLAITYGVVSFNSAARAYIVGNGIWSKAQKDAVYHLTRYVDTKDSSHWHQFRESLAVPLADRRARLAMNREELDWNATASALRAGQNHPDDIPSLIRLYRWFYWEPHIARAIEIWKDADVYIVELRELGRMVHEDIEAGRMTEARQRTLMRRLERIDTSLRPLVDRFSSVLGEAARWLHTVLLWVLLAAAAAILALGAWVVYRITARTFEAEQRFRATFEHAGLGIAHVGLDGQWIRVNRQMCDLLGYSRAELLGMRFYDITHPADRDASDRIADRLLEGEADRLEVTKRYLRRDGRAIWADLTATLLRDINDRPQYFITLVRDVTEEKRLSDELSYRARHDALTGLINRYEFERRLGRAVDRVRLEKTESVLCFLDLDQFKLINDTCGHMAGDALLQQLGPLIRSCVRSNDTVARLGGDEFGILLEACPLETAQRTAEAIRRAIADFRFSWHERSFGLGCSIGLVAFSNELASASLDQQRLMSVADTACYEAKEAGRDQVHVAEVEGQVINLRQNEMDWIERLQRALDEDRLFLVWQPIHVLAAEGESASRFEILVRMRTPEGDIVSPGRFLPAAERYGLAQALDRRVLSLALAWLEDNRRARPELDWVSVNLSGSTINRPGETQRLLEMIEEADVEPEQLCFEITETEAIANLHSAMEFMQGAARLGCRFALDDFGSGVSSFGYLNTLPVDYVKIDGVFVRDMDDNPVHDAMVRSINEIAHSMGKETIAEYVETGAVAEQLREMGVDCGQGFALGYPVAIGEKESGPRVARK